MTDIEKTIQMLELLPKMVTSSRQMRHLKMREAADQMGVNIGTISRLEKGENVTLKNAIAALKWIGSAPS